LRTTFFCVIMIPGKETNIMTSTVKIKKQELLDTYAPQLQPLKSRAVRAYGSRSTDSRNHDASRRFTELLKEYTDKGGSLLMMAEELGVTYPALRRRVMTANLEPLSSKKRSTRSVEEHVAIAQILSELKDTKNHSAYHSAIASAYTSGFSINTLAKQMGLKGAYPLYYGLNKVRTH
jgi:hypothetical protein